MFAATFSSMNQSRRRVKGRLSQGRLSQDTRRLKRHRVITGLSLREASAAAGISLGYLSQLENGKRSASPQVLAALATTYGCHVPELMPPEPKAGDGNPL